MKRGSLALFAALLAVAPGARALELAELMQMLAARGSATASFVEQQQIATLEAPLESSGELSYRAPGELTRHTLLPREELLRYSDGSVTLERGGRKVRLDLRRYPQVLPFVESIRATLAGDEQGLRRLFELSLEGSGQQWRLRLTPRDAQALAQVREVRIEGSAADLLLVIVERPNGDRSVTKITPHAPR